MRSTLTVSLGAGENPHPPPHQRRETTTVARRPPPRGEVAPVPLLEHLVDIFVAGVAVRRGIRKVVVIVIVGLSQGIPRLHTAESPRRERKRTPLVWGRRYHHRLPDRGTPQSHPPTRWPHLPSPRTLLLPPPRRILLLPRRRLVCNENGSIQKGGGGERQRTTTTSTTIDPLPKKKEAPHSRRKKKKRPSPTKRCTTPGSPPMPSTALRWTLKRIPPRSPLPPRIKILVNRHRNDDKKTPTRKKRKERGEGNRNMDLAIPTRTVGAGRRPTREWKKESGRRNTNPSPSLVMAPPAPPRRWPPHPHPPPPPPLSLLLRPSRRREMTRQRRRIIHRAPFSITPSPSIFFPFIKVFLRLTGSS